ncbi:MAG: efflux RND transporter permease subunit, partial [Alphaproteobacteria bacterium]|nr:efflux RND transporter permease subunit [Alphaproteobacteria bacterium]
AQINRKDRVRAIDIYGSSAFGYALSVTTEGVDKIIEDVGLPEGYTGSHEGKSRRMQESSEAIKFAFSIAIVALYMVLASQFNSFTQPFVIMLTAPLSFLGAFVALYFSGQPMTMFAQIGLIGLMGVVMKNGILLVDQANQLREAEGIGAREAIRRAGPLRLRPVLMTAFAMIFGMVPMAFSTSQGSEFRSSLGFLLMGGMISSTLLTFVVVPVAYTFLDDAKRYVNKALVFLRLRKPDEPDAGKDADVSAGGPLAAE